MTTKKCLYCGRFFEKKRNCSQKDWLEQKYCSYECSVDTRFKKGMTTWNKGLKGYRAGKENNMWKGGEIKLQCLTCQKEFSVKPYRKNAKFCSHKCQIENQRLPMERKKSRNIQKEMVKNGLNPNYKGATKEAELIKKSAGYKQWRKSVFGYDNYICWICEIKGGKLHPHHLMDFSLYPELRLKVSNGITLCEFCHRTYTNFGKHFFLENLPQLNMEITSSSKI